MCTNGDRRIVTTCRSGVRDSPPGSLALSGSLPPEAFEVRFHERSHVIPPERSVDECFDVPELVSGVVSDPLELDGPHGRTLASELADSVCEPDLAIAPGAEVLEDLEDFRLEHVAVDCREIAGSVLWRGFLDDSQDL